MLCKNLVLIYIFQFTFKVHINLKFIVENKWRFTKTSSAIRTWFLTLTHLRRTLKESLLESNRKWLLSEMWMWMLDVETLSEGQMKRRMVNKEVMREELRLLKSITSWAHSVTSKLPSTKLNLNSISRNIWKSWKIIYKKTNLKESKLSRKALNYTFNGSLITLTILLFTVPRVTIWKISSPFRTGKMKMTKLPPSFMSWTGSSPTKFESKFQYLW